MSEEKIQKLFTEFPGITAKEWEDQILKDLKGADYNKKLIWKTIEGLDVKPFYRAEDLENIGYLKENGGKFPFIKNTIEGNNAWSIQQEIEVSDIAEANSQALKAILGGCTCICFVINDNIHDHRHFNFSGEEEFSKLMKGIDLKTILIKFKCGYDSPAMIVLFDEYAEKEKLNKANVNVHYDYDPLGFLVLNGFIYNEEDRNKALNLLFKLYGLVKNNLPSSRFIGVHGNYFNNSGADAVQELAFSLSMANEYLSFLSDKGIAVEDIAKSIYFNFGVGSNYFIEIAKLRASRYLFATILKAYSPGIKDCMYIHSVTTGINKTIYDPHVNMLRSTTEAMSAIIGGCNSLYVEPFDNPYTKPDDFSMRIAKNIQVVLKEETNLDKVLDPAGGSYYIENLTNLLIEKAWDLFNVIEDKGGFLKAFCDGFIQSEIKKTCDKHNADIAIKKEVLLGTNQYPNLKERARDSIHYQEKGNEKNDDQIIFSQPLNQFRTADKFEQLRLFTEEIFSTVPKVFLLTFGNPAMRKARAAFATNFFGCAGFEIIDNPGFYSPSDGIIAALDSGAEIVVLCSSDEEYKDSVKVFLKELKDRTIVVLAGFPADLVEEFRKEGMEHFIHIKSNMLETLKQFQTMILNKNLRTN